MGLPAAGATAPESLFERCSWFYALCREYLFRDHTPEITDSLLAPVAPADGTHLIEVGCGPGFYCCKLAQNFPKMRTTGIDLSERLRRRAWRRAADRRLTNASFVHGDAHHLPLEDNEVDAVVVSRLFLIVVQDRERVIAEIHRVLKGGGRCFIAEPTSGFRTRIPLAVMWVLSKVSRSPAGLYREPRQAEVMPSTEFKKLIRSQPWESIEVTNDGWYQYAVCEKRGSGAGSVPVGAVQSAEGSL